MENKSSSNTIQVFWLSIGQIGSFALSFVSAAILSRYLSVDEYGSYKQILYLYTTATALFTFGIPSAFSYFLPRLSLGQQKTLVNNLNNLLFLLGLIFSIIIYFSSGLISNLLRNSELELGLKIFSIFPIFTIPVLGIQAIYTALKKTKIIALYEIVTRIIMLCSIVLPVIFIKADYKTALIGWGISSFFTFLIAIYLKNRPFARVKKEKIHDMYKSVANYTTPLLGAVIAGFFINAADQFFISRYYGVKSFADYSNGCISVPVIAILVTSVKKVLLPIFSKADNEGDKSELLKIYDSSVYKTIIIVFPILIFTFLFSKEIIVIIYGEKYIDSYKYMRLYMIRDFAEVLPYFSVLLAIGKSKVYMYMHIFGAIYIWCMNYVAVYFNLGPTIVVLVATSFALLNRFISIYYIYTVTKMNLISKNILKMSSKVLIHSSICVFVIYHVSENLDLENNFILKLLISGCLFYILLIFTSRLIKINYLESLYTMFNFNKNKSFGKN